MANSQTSKLEKLGVVCLQVGLLGLFGFLMVKALITFVTPSSVWIPTKSSTVAVVNTASQQTARDFSFDPFHREVVESPVLDAPIEIDAPETSLNLELKGYTVPVSAIIKTPDNRELAYAVDDDIIDGVVLKAVYPGYVILSRRGANERLTFKNEISTGLSSPLNTKLSRSTANQSSPSNPRDSVQNQPAGLLSQISYQRVNDANGIKGFAITLPPTGRKNTGLMSGDIVTHIGGTDLRSNNVNLANLFARNARRKTIVMRLIRDGDAKTIRVKL